MAKCYLCGEAETAEGIIMCQECYRKNLAKLQPHTWKPEEGTKHDQDKTMWSLCNFDFLTEIAEVMTFGAKKYSPDNWKKVPDAEKRYFDAAMRHMTAYFKGETADEESGKSHLAHAACCLMFLYHFEKQKEREE